MQPRWLMGFGMIHEFKTPELHVVFKLAVCVIIIL